MAKVGKAGSQIAKEGIPNGPRKIVALERCERQYQRHTYAEIFVENAGGLRVAACLKLFGGSNVGKGGVVDEIEAPLKASSHRKSGLVS